MPTEIDLKYERAEGYRNVVIDNAATVALADTLGVRMHTMFTRMEGIPRVEKALRRDDGGIELIAGAAPVVEYQKTVEVSVIALNIANNLLKALDSLPSQYKSLYGIPSKLPQIQPIPAKLPG